MEKRPNFIDYAKTLSIYLVVLGHFTYSFNIPFEDVPVWNLMHVITLFHMPFFFIVSGMLFNKSELCTTLSKGWIQLIVPYLLIALISFGIVLLTDNHISNIDILKYIAGVVSGYDLPKSFSLPCGAMWFCYALFFIKILYILIGQRGGVYHVVVIFFGFTIMFIGNKLWFRIDSMLVGYIFFSLGQTCRNILLNINKMKIFSRIVLIVVCATILYISAYFNLDLTTRQGLSINACYFGSYPPLFIIGGVAGSLMILTFCSFIKIKRNIMISLSNGTIITLGFHWIINSYALTKLFNNDSVTTALLVSAINCTICYLLILLCERKFPILLGNRQKCL